MEDSGIFFKLQTDMYKVYLNSTNMHDRFYIEK